MELKEAVKYLKEFGPAFSALEELVSLAVDLQLQMPVKQQMIKALEQTIGEKKAELAVIEEKLGKYETKLLAEIKTHQEAVAGLKTEQDTQKHILEQLKKEASGLTTLLAKGQAQVDKKISEYKTLEEAAQKQYNAVVAKVELLKKSVAVL